MNRCVTFMRKRKSTFRTLVVGALVVGTVIVVAETALRTVACTVGTVWYETSKACREFYKPAFKALKKGAPI